ncbi:MAG: sensor histidine kinase [Bacteroidetes bacterium]|nr:sensor histidine kinase [Bacteroidota bacterium]
MLKHKIIVFLYILSFITQRIFCQETYSHKKADSLFKIGLYAEALEVNIKVFEAAQNRQDCKELASAYLQLGHSYYYLFKKQKALHYFKLSALYGEKCNLDTILSKCYRNLGAMYIELNNADSATYYFTLAKPILKKLNNPTDLTSFYALLSAFYLETYPDKKQCELALDSSFYYAKKSNNNQQLGYCHMKKGLYYRHYEDYKKAASEYNIATNYYLSDKSTEGLMYAYEQLAFVYKMQINADSCFYFFSKFKYLRDSVYSKKTAENIAKYESLFETKKKEIENLDLKQKNQQLFWLIIFGVIIAAGTSFFIFKIKSIRKQKIFDEQLREQQRLRFLEVMQVQEQERTGIASDLHDGVGHLLSAIKLNVSALSKQNQGDINITNNLNDIIDTASLEVRQISHQLMPQSLSELGLLTSLNELAHRINKSNSIVLLVKSNIENISLSKKSQIVVYRIIQEILNNIIKHSGAKTIQINVTCDDPKLILSITDDGKFFDSKLIRSTEGIGWKNIKARIELFNGMYEIISSNTNGTKIIVTLFPEFETTSF